MTSWIARIACSRSAAEAAMALDDPFPGIELPPVLASCEDEVGWRLELHTEKEPEPDLLDRLRVLAGGMVAPVQVEEIPDTDWVVRSQAGQAPVDAGRFHIHPSHRAGEAKPGQIALRIEASLAFGTGQHATTAGCLRMIDRLRKRGRLGRVLDLGTGSGVLAIAAARSDRRARIVATDIDPVAIRIARGHARANRANAITLEAGAGLGVAAIRCSAPHDLVLANILAKPLMALSEGLSHLVRPGGYVVLAGLLANQERGVAAAFLARGFQRAGRIRGAWPVLLMVRRGQGPPPPRAAVIRAARRGRAAAWRSAGTI